MHYADNYYVSDSSPSLVADSHTESFLIDGSNAVLAAVCDGVGDHLKGKAGAAEAIEGIRRKWHSLTEAEKLIPSTQLVLQLAESGRENLSYNHQTTLALAVIRNHEYSALNIGDSPVFLVSERRSQELSRRDNLYYYKRENGFHAEPKDKSIPRYHLGNGHPDLYHCTTGRLFSGESLLLCTDGFDLAIPPDPAECFQVICNTRNTGDNATAVLLTLID